MKRLFFFLVFSLFSSPCFAEVFQCGTNQLSIRVDVPSYWKYAPTDTGCKFSSQKNHSDFISIMSYPNFPGSPQQLANAHINGMKQGEAFSATGDPIVYHDFDNLGDTCVIHASVLDTPVKFIFSKIQNSIVIIQTGGDNYKELEKIIDSIEFSN
ncbi:MAG: hypothetical protein IJU76_00310 [Desulfovibrionaceae bacterium]|nr:hypothetical protein [Desulfovibrionaceae bacterium]